MIITIDDLADIRDQHLDKTIVLTGGTFDMLHVGHLHYLSQVKKLGELVVVILSGDGRVKGRKGPSRPIIPEQDRAAMLDALEIVDYVFIDPAEHKAGQIDPIHTEIITRLQPDFYATDGPDFRFLDVMDKSKQITIPRESSPNLTSTTAIIKRIIGS